MCGIAGIISKNMGTKDVDYFRFLLFLNQLRGVDSTGVFSIEEPTGSNRKRINKGAGIPVRYFKSAESAQNFMQHKNVDKFLSAYSPGKMSFVGHTRAATIGAVHEDNAHPFSFDKLVGLVNGTVTKSEIPGEEEYDTDSEAMLAYMNDVTPEVAIPKLLGLTRAGFAMVYYDRAKNTMNFIRSATGDDTRPLSFALSKNKETMVFSSESGMLRFAAERCEYPLLDYEHKDEETGELMNFGPQVWSYKVNQLVIVPMEKDFYSNIKVQDITPDTSLRPVKKTYTSPATSSYGSGQGYVGGDRGFAGQSSKSSGANVPPRPINWKNYLGTTEAKADIGELPWSIGGPSDASEESDRIYRGPQGSLISAAKFERYVSKPCASCTVQLDPSDADLDEKIAWVKGDAGWEPVCEECRDLPFMLSFICDDPRKDK